MCCVVCENLIMYSGYAWASWYVTKMEGSLILSTVQSYRMFRAASRTSGVSASLTPLDHWPTTARTKKMVCTPWASGAQYNGNVEYDASRLAFRGWLAGALAWMLPMPLVHAPVSLLIARLYQSKELLCDFDAPPVASEHRAWFADPSAAELRELLRAYLEAWGPSGFAGRFRNATPDHFAMFVLHRMRAKGHGSLSHVASKRIESVFEEWVEALLEEDKNAEETKE